MELSNITLAWMIAQLEPFIDFHPNYIQEQHQATHSYYEQSGQEPRPWSFGMLTPPTLSCACILTRSR